MAVATIAINFSTVNQVLQGTSTNTSINPAVLRTAFQTNPSTFYLSLPSLTATYYGSGSNLTGSIVRSVSGVAQNAGPSIQVAITSTNIASVSVIPPFPVPWHIGKTGKPLLQETGANRMSMAYVLSAETKRFIEYITTKNVSISSSAFTVTRTPAGFDSSGSSNYSSGLLLMDGRIFCLPYLPTNPVRSRIYDPRTNTVTTPSPTFPSTFHMACVMSDGRVLATGFGANTNFFIIYDPALDTLTTPPGTYTPFGMNGMTLLPDGRVFCAAYGTNTFPATHRIYDPVTNTVTTPPVASPGLYDYNGCVTMYDGRVYCVPDSTTCATIYNPYTNTFTTPAGVFPSPQPVTTSENLHSGGVVMADGRIFLIPLSYTTPRIYDPQTDTLSTPAWDGTGSYGKGFLLPDGRVFCTKYDAGGLGSGHRIYDPKTNTLQALKSDLPAIYYTGGSYPSPQGEGMKVFLAPYQSSGSGFVYSFYADTGFPLSVHTNPTFRNNAG